MASVTQIGPDAPFDAVHMQLLHRFDDLVVELGGDSAAIRRQAGLPAGAMAGQDADADAGYRYTVELFETAARTLDCPDFGMRLARLQGVGALGPLGLAMRHSRSFGDALDYVAHHNAAHSLAARIWLERDPAQGQVFAGHDILLDRMPNGNQAMEHILLLGDLAAQHFTGGRVRVRRVHFRHQPHAPLSTYRRNFRCEVLFGEDRNGVVYSEEDLRCPVVSPDADTYDRVTAYIDRHFTQRRPPLHAQVRGLVMQWLGTGTCTGARLAAALNLHPRTLHRRLSAQGTTVQKIKDQVRREMVLYYLTQTDMEVAQISERLGFAEQSVLTRCCQRWFAAPPTRLRQEAGRLAD